MEIKLTEQEVDFLKVLLNLQVDEELISGTSKAIINNIINKLNENS